MNHGYSIHPGLARRLKRYNELVWAFRDMGYSLKEACERAHDQLEVEAPDYQLQQD